MSSPPHARQLLTYSCQLPTNSRQRPITTNARQSSFHYNSINQSVLLILIFMTQSKLLEVKSSLFSSIADIFSSIADEFSPTTDNDKCSSKLFSLQLDQSISPSYSRIYDLI